MLGCEIGYIDGEILGFILVTAYGIKFVFHEMTDIVSLIFSYERSKYFMIYGCNNVLMVWWLCAYGGAKYGKLKG